MNRPRQRRTGTKQKLRQETEFIEQPQPPSLHLSDLELKEKFERLRENRKIEQAKKTIKNLYGKHYPVDYKPEYHFQQSWETIRTSTIDDRKYSSWKNSSKIFNIIQLLLIVLYGCSLWFLSVHRIFRISSVNQYLISAILIAQIMDIVLEQICQTKSKNIALKQVVQKHIKSIIFVIYLCFTFIEQQLLEKHLEALIPIDLLFGVKIYRRLKQLYVLLKIKIPSYWRNEVEITQLVGGCLILVHTFSIVLYVASQSDGRANWTLGVATFNNSWAYRYIFSVYFACTTMFTVGYGDITPQNPWEILAVLTVQVVGIINMGYVINEVGRCLSKINEGEELLYRGISDAEKLSENYDLPAGLSQRLTSFVVNNQIANSKFNVEEQNSFLDKLSEEVRQDVTGHTKFQLIKTSVFFLCHWTKKLQRTIADKLIRQVYSPEQVLPQIHGKEKIYVLSRGKLDVQANFFSRQRPLSRKRLATIEIKSDKQVHFNTYGYTALISGHKLNLCAVARDYSICYYVDKESFVSAVEQNFTDFEYFHEIRSKIEESHCRQSFQAPKINNTKEHYRPNVYFIVKRQGRINQKVKSKQKRQSMLRLRKKENLILYSEEGSLEERQCLNIIQKRSSIQNISQDLSEEAEKKNSNKYIGSIGSLKQIEQIKEKEIKYWLILKHFESAKNYSFFLKKFNPERIISKYNSKYFKEEDVETFVTSFILKSSGGVDNITEHAIKKLLRSKTIKST